jgi:hypothetical protein
MAPNIRQHIFLLLGMLSRCMDLLPALRSLYCKCSYSLQHFQPLNSNLMDIFCKLRFLNIHLDHIHTVRFADSSRHSMCDNTWSKKVQCLNSKRDSSQDYFASKRILARPNQPTDRHLCSTLAALQAEPVSSLLSALPSFALVLHKATQAVPCRPFHMQHNVSKEFSICQ